MPLTDTAIRNARPREKRFKLADGGGLYLLVNERGNKLWRMDYAFGGKRKTLSFGAYPTVKLLDARQLRDAAKRQLALGLDPSYQKKKEKRAAKAAGANTFGAVAEEYLDKMLRERRAEATLNKNRWMMTDLAAPLLRRPMTEISAAEVLEVLRAIERSGRIESALATRAAIGRVFRFAIATARAENDPTFALRGALQDHEPVHHPTITNAGELGPLMSSIYKYDGWQTLTAALKIQALCFARPSETRTMEWTELNLDSELWTVPASKAKMRRPHQVPLSKQALAIVSEMKSLSSDSRYVFPSMAQGKSTLSENAMNSALRRMGYSHNQHTAHGFRSTASTLLNESGMFSSDAIEAQLAHLDPQKVRRIYNRARYWEERVAMMQWWADFLDAIRKKADQTAGAASRSRRQ